MEILYTEITEDLTEILLNRAKVELEKGKKVFYIVPSSMSFEKEKEILQRLENGNEAAVFDLLVTRFKQLPYYFRSNLTQNDKTELTQIGFSMLFRRVLKSFDKAEIPLYHSLSGSSNFLQMLIDLRAELISSNLTIDDLPKNPKNQELGQILQRFEEELSKNYANFSEFQAFTAQLDNENLEKYSFVIDGYTRFSAEEEELITKLEEKTQNVIIGTFASERDLKRQQNELSIYKNSLELIRKFQGKFAASVKKEQTKSVNQVYTKLTNLIKKDIDFTNHEVIEFDKKSAKNIEIWRSENQAVEIENVAKQIRQLIVNHVNFKDITVLVGHRDSYAVTLKEIFNLYEIPYFYAKDEAMTNHGLIVMLESLLAIKQKNYQTQDIVNLMKTKVYSTVNLNHFEYYINTYKIRGRAKFAADFVQENYPKLDEINRIREQYLGEKSPIQQFLTGNTAKTGQKWVEIFQKFLAQAEIPQHLQAQYEAAESENNHELAEKHHQVWQLLLSNLTEFLEIFAVEKMKVTEFLEILLSGFQNSNYRQIPANVDVINVKDYELVEARTNKYVFAIGLSATNFPRLKANSTLLTDEERLEINENADEGKFIEPILQSNYSKSIFTTASLVNAATEKLVLSTPQIYGNIQEENSLILQLFMNHLPKNTIKKINNVSPNETLQHIGNRRATLATIGKIEHQMQENSEENSVFWSSIFRILTKDDEKFRQLLLNVERDIEPVNLTVNTVNQIHGEEMNASVSSFERFYNCGYQYFLENTLKLKMPEEIDLNARQVGEFFHEIFENIMKLSNLTSENFDENLDQIITNSRQNYQQYFSRDAKSRFIELNLLDIVKQTGTRLKADIVNPDLTTLSTELSFGFPNSQIPEFRLDNVKLRGRIDRVDQWNDGSLTAIDYKSSKHDFELKDFYDGTSLQLLTYLDVLHKSYPENTMKSALYLHLQNQAISLSKIKNLSEIDSELKKNNDYQGLRLQEESSKAKNVYTFDEFDKLIDMNEQHYKNAVNTIKSGQININPIANDKQKTVHGCQYCKLKAICRFEANEHFTSARIVGQKSAKEIKNELKGANHE